MSTPETRGRPSVDDVALLLRVRTKDSAQNEIGTFDDETRPTADQVEEQITAAYDLISMRLPTIAKLPDDLLPGMAQVVALDAACRIEKSFFPEQIDRAMSSYNVLKTERDEELAALVTRAVDAAGGSEYEMPGISMIKVGSWTSIGPECEVPVP